MKNRVDSVSVRAWVLCVSVLALSGTAAAGQSISGTVMDEKGPLRGVVVTFLDGTNAELISTATTDFNGAYSSALIPPGRYRVRFSDSSHHPAFFGTVGFDDFCEGAVVDVLPDTTTSSVDQVLRLTEPSEIPLNSGDIRGVVVDATTGTPLAAIKVSIFDAARADVFLEAVTGANGEYNVGFKDLFRGIGRVRFSSQENLHFPQFFGAGGSDDFCLGTAVNLLSKAVADAFMQPIPGQQAENLLQQVQNLDLPESVVTVLATPLVHAATLLTDGNAGNDQGVCGQLTAFITRVDMQERRGQLSPIEAASLRDSAQALKVAIGCQ